MSASSAGRIMRVRMAGNGRWGQWPSRRGGFGERYCVSKGAVEGEGLGCNLTVAEAGFREPPPGGAHTAAGGGIGGEAGDGVGESRRVARRHQDAVLAVTHDLAQAGAIG